MAQIIVLPKQTAIFTSDRISAKANVSGVDFSKLSTGDKVLLDIDGDTCELIYAEADNCAVGVASGRAVTLFTNQVDIAGIQINTSLEVFATAEVSVASGSKMTNAEALKELLVAVGGTEPEEAKTNLELLNAISEQLGGNADAESNAEAIYNIAQNASGGGGGSKIYFVNSLSSAVSVKTTDGKVQIASGERAEITIPKINSADIAVSAPLNLISVRDAAMAVGAKSYGVTGQNCSVSIFASVAQTVGYAIAIQISITSEQAATGEAVVTFIPK